MTVKQIHSHTLNMVIKHTAVDRRPFHHGQGRCLYVQFTRILTGSLRNTHTHPFNSPLSRTTQVSRYQKGKTNLDFTEARDSVWQWHQLGHMQIGTSLQTNNPASTPPLKFLQDGYLSCCPTNSVKALKALTIFSLFYYNKEQNWKLLHTVVYC